MNRKLIFNQPVLTIHCRNIYILTIIVYEDVINVDGNSCLDRSFTYKQGKCNFSITTNLANTVKLPVTLNWQPPAVNSKVYSACYQIYALFELK